MKAREALMALILIACMCVGAGMCARMLHNAAQEELAFGNERAGR